jgi:hypothetical protein
MSSTFQKEKGERGKICVSNDMEKVLFQVIRGEISFFEKFLKIKKNKIKIQKYFFGLIL